MIADHAHPDAQLHLPPSLPPSLGCTWDPHFYTCDANSARSAHSADSAHSAHSAHGAHSAHSADSNVQVCHPDRVARHPVLLVDK